MAKNQPAGPVAGPAIVLTAHATLDDAWGPAGLHALAALLPDAVTPDGEVVATETRLREALAAATAVTPVAGRFWFSTWGNPADSPREVRDAVNQGFCQTLLGVATQRSFGTKPEGAGEKELPPLDWHALQTWPKQSGSGKILLTRAQLPNWQAGVKPKPQFSPEQAIPCLFAAGAATALPLPRGEAVLLAPWGRLDLSGAAALCRAALPRDADECVPASAADAVMSLMLRLRDAGTHAGVVAWRYGRTPANNKFREIVEILRVPPLPAEAIARWADFASRVPPRRRHAVGGLFGDPMRGFVAGNVAAGRQPWFGYADFATGLTLEGFRYTGRGARALYAVYYPPPGPKGESLAARLARLREAAGLTQSALAEKAGLAKQAVSLLELGQRRPSADTAVAIAAALGLPVGQLLGEGNP